MSSGAAKSASRIARRRYDRIAPVYDLMQGLMESQRSARWRRLLWDKAQGSQVLEVGVGTGKNFPYYPSGVRITAIDFSRRMLGRARLKVQNEHLPVELLLMDVERLALQENSFDAVVASFVFCSTPHPVQGLKELLRVCKPGGKILLLEHVRSANPFLGKLMDLLNPVIVRIFGANINRNTVTNVERSGLRLEKVTDLWGGIVKLIEARK